MDPQIYVEMAGIEDKHWWFVARRKIVNKIIKNLALPKNTQILEAGCGTGGNLSMLSCHGDLYGMELDELALDFAFNRQICPILPGKLPNEIPFENCNFDLVVLLDVLEHLEKDLASLQALKSRIKPGGWLLITVPAKSWLWSEHDVLHHHYRRYVRSSLVKVVKSAGYDVSYVSYYNFILFPLIAIARTLQRFFLSKSNQSKYLTVPSSLINNLLTNIFASERFFIGNLYFPFGVSLLLLAKNNT